MRDPVANFAPYALVELSASGIILETNESFSRWFSPSRPELVGSRLCDVLGVEETELSAALLATAGGYGLTPETAILRPASPTARPMTVASNTLENGNIVVTVIDASRQQTSDDDLKQAHLASLRESERLQLLLSASVSFADATSASELAEVLAETARRSFRADHASVHLIEGREFLHA